MFSPHTLQMDDDQPQLQATEAQRDALQALEMSLTCRLCDKFVSQPVSLGCGHFFCQTCIEQHVRTNWNCPGKTGRDALCVLVFLALQLPTSHSPFYFSNAIHLLYR